MRHAILMFLLAASATLASSATLAQVPVQANPNHEQLLASADPRLATNKKLVYDFYREVFEGGHMELAEKYLAESYIQHNPTVPTGRAGFVDLFSKFVDGWGYFFHAPSEWQSQCDRAPRSSPQAGQGNPSGGLNQQAWAEVESSRDTWFFWYSHGFRWLHQALATHPTHPPH